VKTSADSETVATLRDAIAGMDPDVAAALPELADALEAVAGDPALITQLLDASPELRGLVESAREQFEEQLHQKPAARACASCPSQLKPFGTKKASPKARVWFYLRKTRNALWNGFTVQHEDGIVPGAPGYGLKDGGKMTCHLTVKQIGSNLEQAEAHACAGAIALQHRCLIRWLAGGELAPLTPKGAQRVVAAMFKDEAFKPDDVDVFQLGSWRRLRARGLEITLADVLERAHPSAFDPLVVIEECYGPTPDELEAWSRVRNGD
jgi:hypothetical protein